MVGREGVDLCERGKGRRCREGKDNTVEEENALCKSGEVRSVCKTNLQLTVVWPDTVIFDQTVRAKE